MMNVSQTAPLNPAEQELVALFERKDEKVLERQIPGTTILGNVRVRLHCEYCKSEEVRSAPKYWRSMMELTGECFKCDGYVPIATTFFDKDRKPMVIVSPSDKQQQLLEKLAVVADFVLGRRSNANNAQSAVQHATPKPLELSQVAKAILTNNKDEVIRLLKDHSIDTIVERGMTSLCYAASHGKKDVVQALLDNKADVNATSKDSMRAIHGAASCKNSEVVEKLLEAKANPNDVDANGFRPLHIACIEGQNDVCRLLLENKAEVNAATMTKATAMHLVARNGDPETIVTLLGAKAEVNCEDVFGRTPLANAFYFDKKKDGKDTHELAGKALLDAGASLHKVKKDIAIPAWAGGEQAREFAINQQRAQQVEQSKAKLQTEIASATAKLKEEHEAAIAKIKEENAAAISKLIKAHEEVTAQLREDNLKVREDNLKLKEDNLKLKEENANYVEAIATLTNSKSAELIG